ncbi:hypothetical protein ACJX0J_007664, partial [Zea mays]
NGIGDGYDNQGPHYPMIVFFKNKVWMMYFLEEIGPKEAGKKHLLPNFSLLLIG